MIDLKVSEQEHTLIVSALIETRGVNQVCAKIAREINQERIAEQFDRQAESCNTLLARIES